MRAPELAAGDWFNTAAPLTLATLRGRFVLLDFWTSCCGNCLHVLDELRVFEETCADIVTVIGVHAPKFPHEASSAAVAAAIGRHEVRHPVLSDPQLRLWGQYAVRAWPTLVLIDPEGYVVAQAAGEGHVSAFQDVLDQLAIVHEASGTLRRGMAPEATVDPSSGTLRFPAKAITLPPERTGRDEMSLLVADAGHHQVVELALDGITELRRFGRPVRGLPFAEPNGLTLLPAGFVQDVDLLVADTAGHVLRGLRLSDGAVTRVYDLPAALADARTVTGAVPSTLSPWDVAWWPAIERVVVAAAGTHLLLALDPRSGAVEILAGTTVEGLRDGAPRDAWLAQPSALAVDGERLWFVDAESSALRWLDAGGDIGTAVGSGLFDFGHIDGPAAAARLQHPLGIATVPDGSIAIADTYNGALRRYDPASDQVCTLADGLAEPSGVLLVAGEPVVVESAAHRLVRPHVSERSVAAPAEAVARPPARLRAGAVTLTVPFTPPPGRELDDRDGPATTLTVTAMPPQLLLAGGGTTTELTRQLRLRPGAGVLQVIAQAASCDADPATEHPACHLARQDWGVPIVVSSDDGDGRLALPLFG